VAAMCIFAPLILNKNGIENLVVHKKSSIFAAKIVVWCNGSTTGFGSVCRGSNPRTNAFNFITFKNVLPISSYSANEVENSPLAIFFLSRI
jgi:hypothetical protein